MLDSLREFSTGEAIGLLSRVGSTFTPPDPLENNETKVEPVSFHGENVLAEIRQRLSLDPKDNSDETRDKILFFISDQLSQIALEGVDETAIKIRLARKHLLRPNLYDVEFPDSFAGALDRSFTQEDVQTTLNYPDETFSAPLLSPKTLKEKGQFRLFVKHYREGNPKHNFSFLVVAWQKDISMRIADALRVYPQDVDISRVTSPLDVFRAFVDEYGFICQIGAKEAKLFLLEVVPKTQIHFENRLAGFDPVFYQAPVGSEVFSISLTERTKTGYEVAFAYALDEERYRRDLRRHGVKAARLASMPLKGFRSELY